MNNKIITIKTGRVGRLQHPAFQRTVNIRYCGATAHNIMLSLVDDQGSNIIESAAVSYPHPGSPFVEGDGPQTFEIEDVRNREVITLRADSAEKNEIELELLSVENVKKA